MYKLEEILSISSSTVQPNLEEANKVEKTDNLLPSSSFEFEQNLNLPVTAVSVGFLSDKTTLLIALAFSDNSLTVLFAKADWCLNGFDHEILIEKYSLPPDPEKQIACLAVSPSGRYIACVLENGSVQIIPTKLILGEISAHESGVVSLFSEEEITHIGLKVRDDCLCLPTCAVWHETIHARRPVLIYSNKGGDILFVDLLIRKLYVSLEAPQSIHNIDIVQDATVSDTYLLASGFAGSQWMVPLELGDQTLRETLSNIIPSELRELDSSGTVSTLISHGTKCVGLLNQEKNVFQIFNTVAMRNAAIEIKLPDNSWTLHYADSVTFVLRNQSEVVASVNFSGTFNASLESAAAQNYVSYPGSLPECRFLGFVPVRFALRHGQLPSCILISEHCVNFLKPTCTGIDLFFQCLSPTVDLHLAQSLCDALEMDFRLTAVSAVSKIMEKKLENTENNNNLDVALKLADAAELPQADTARLFYEQGHGKFILPHLTKWLMTSSQQMNDITKKDLCLMAFKLHVRMVLDSSDYEKNVQNHQFKDFLYHNIHYPAESCLTDLIKSELYDCAVVILKLHDLEAVAMRQVLSIVDWKLFDDFVELLTFPNMASVFVADHQMALEYLNRLKDFSKKMNTKRHLRLVANLTNPNRSEIRRLLAVREGPDYQNAKQLLSQIADLFLSCLIRYLYFDDISSSSHSLQNSAINGIKNRFDAKPISCGSHHCVLSATDGIYAWGRTKLALLGSNVSSDPAKHSLPIKVDLDVSTVAVFSVVCGCDHSLILLDNGHVYGFGQNKYGQLGLGHRMVCEKPQLIDSLVAKEEFITKISSGNYHCAAITTNGNVYVWGWNVHGQLGLSNRQLDDMLVPTLNHFFVDQELTIDQVACGHAHTVFLTTDGQLYASGNSTYGQLGLGATRKITIPTKIQADFGGGKVNLLSSGFFHTVVVTSEKRLFTWGSTPQALKFKALLQKRKNAANGESGKVEMNSNDASKSSLSGVTMEKAITGGNNEGRHLRPIEIELSGGLASKSEKIVQINCGFSHSALLTERGQLYSWGKSLEFQLGHGDKKERSTPTLLTTLGDGMRWRYVACGFEHTLAIDHHGFVWGWGRDDFGQLGFESVAKEQQHRFAGKVLTIQRANKSQRTITLPQDGRVFVSKPTKLLGLAAAMCSPEGLSHIVPSYDQSTLFESLKLFVGYFDPLRISTVCQEVKIPEIGAFVWLINGMVLAALKMHAEALKERTQQLNSIDVRMILDFYQPFLVRIQNGVDKKNAIFAIIQEFPFNSPDLEIFFDNNIDIWANILSEIIRCEPEVLANFSPQFKLKIIKTTLNQGKQQDVNRNSKKYVEIAHSDIQSAHDLCYRFGGCGHVMAESSLQSALGSLQTKHKLNSVLPRTASLTQELYAADKVMESASYRQVASHLCPSCLGTMLSNLVDQLTD